MHRSDDCYNFLLCGKRDRAADLCTCFLCCFNDLRCRLVDQFVIVSFETDSDFGISHKKSPLLFVLFDFSTTSGDCTLIRVYPATSDTQTHPIGKSNPKYSVQWPCRPVSLNWTSLLGKTRKPLIHRLRQPSVSTLYVTTAIIIRHKDRDCKCFFAFFQNFSLISDKKTSHLSIIF